MEETPEDSPVRFPHGFYEIGFFLDGSTPSSSVSEVRDRLRESGRMRFTGWPPFLEMSTPEWAPYAHDNHVVAWGGRPGPQGQIEKSAGHSDYWRVSTDGKLYMIRGFQEDDMKQSRVDDYRADQDTQGSPTWALVWQNSSRSSKSPRSDASNLENRRSASVRKQIRRDFRSNRSDFDSVSVHGISRPVSLFDNWRSSVFWW